MSELKKVTNSKFEVTTNIDKDRWLEAQKKARNKAISKVNIKGFRKGHVPEDIAKKYVNEGEVLNDAINELLPSEFENVMKEHNLNPIIRPQVNVDKLTKDELTVRFTIITTPEVKLGNYKGLKIEKANPEVKDEDVDNDIKGLLKKNAELVVKEDAAKLGDTVVLDFEGFVDGAKFDGGSSKNYELKLGSGQFIPGFEDQLVGLKAGESKEVKVKFPDQYVENLKGKDATFKCRINEVKQEVIPELNDETVKDLNIKDVATVAALKENRKNVLLAQKTKEIEEKFYNDLIENIVKNSTVDVPDELIDVEVESMEADLKQRIEQNGLKFDQYLQIVNKKEEDLKNEFKVNAKKNIITTFVLNQITRNENIGVSEEEVEAEFKRIADLYKMEVSKVKEYLGKDMAGFRNSILSNKLHAKLIELNK